jgi:DHA1 family tetracycline resistance protein-like MFS transporter
MPFGWLLPIVAVLIAGGNGLIMPSLNALISRNSTSETQGVNIGLTQSAGALGRIVGPMIAGGMFEAVAPAAPMASAAAMAACVAVVAFMMIHEVRPDAGR